MKIEYLSLDKTRNLVYNIVLSLKLPPNKMGWLGTLKRED